MLAHMADGRTVPDSILLNRKRTGALLQTIITLIKNGHQARAVALLQGILRMVRGDDK